MAMGVATGMSPSYGVAPLSPDQLGQTAGVDFTRYVFRSEWRLPARPDDVYAVLEDLATYPSWWPEVKRTRRLDDDAAEVTCRSVLPYDLVFVTTQERRDPFERVLQARMAGDLDGFSRWTITEVAGGTSAVFDEDVVTNKPLLNRLAPVARPVFQGNHWLMMRHGQRGLATFLAGYGFRVADG
jgi:Polyketide cyclase / dehydrase and lipid transport